MDHALEDNWDQHWADFGQTSAQAPATKYRTALILKLLDLERSPAPVRMLDIGSGPGDFAAAFKERYPHASLTGLEMSAEAVAIAARKVPSATFLQRNLLLPVEAADAEGVRATHAVCSEVLEHLDEPERLLKNVSAYFAPGCRLIVTVPGGPMSRFERQIGHRKQYTRAELRSLLARAGFQVEAVYGAGFPFFNLYKIMLFLRGAKLMDDVTAREGQSLSVRWGTIVFNTLFRFNCMFCGWQMIAIARWPGR